MADEFATYEDWLASLPGCIVCGRVDPMDYIEGNDMCAACRLEERHPSDDDDYDGECW